MATLWQYAPNEISERLEFRTEVLRSRTDERRVSYADAIQSFIFRYTFDPILTETILAAFKLNPSQEFLVPEWPTATFSKTGGLIAGDTIVPVEDVVVYPDGQKIIIGRGEFFEQAEVLSSSGTLLTLTTPLLGSYGASQEEPLFIAPLLRCISPKGFNFVQRPNFNTLEVGFYR